jgi:putative methyltransferase (TIGR04325 family)
MLKKFFKLFNLLGKNHLEFTGPYESWQEAVSNSSGYDSDIVIKKVKKATQQVLLSEKKYERDGTAFDSTPENNTLINLLQKYGINEKKIVDVGGGLGSLYINYKEFFEDRVKNYYIIEQNKFCIEGELLAKKYDLNLKYLTDLSLINEDIDYLICSSFLQYIENWNDYVNLIIKKKPEYIIIDRHPLSKDRSEIYVQLNTGYYESDVSYPLHILEKQDFLSSFHGYEMLDEWDSDFDPLYFKGFLLKKSI